MFNIPPPNYTQTPNVFFDEWIPKLKEGELRVLLVIMRQTFGWRKVWDYISLAQLEKKTGMERMAVLRSIKSLIEKRLVAKRKEGLVGKEKCWYSLITEGVEEEPLMPDDESDIYEDSNNSYQYPKDTPPSILKIPTKETLTKENISPIVPKGDTFPLSSKRKKVKEEAHEVAPGVTLTNTQRVDILRRLNNNPEKACACYDKLSAWKIEKGFVGGSDYKHMIKWVIKSIESEASKPIPINPQEANKKMAQDAEILFPKLIQAHGDSVGFVAGNYSKFIDYRELGFKDQFQNQMRKMGLLVTPLKSIEAIQSQNC